MPTSSAKAKSCSVPPPKSSRQTTGSRVINEVLMDRVSVSQIDRLTMSPYGMRLKRGSFSRMRS